MAQRLYERILLKEEDQKKAKNLSISTPNRKNNRKGCQDYHDRISHCKLNVISTGEIEKFLNQPEKILQYKIQFKYNQTKSYQTITSHIIIEDELDKMHLKIKMFWRQFLWCKHGFGVLYTYSQKSCSCQFWTSKKPKQNKPNQTGKKRWFCCQYN